MISRLLVQNFTLIDKTEIEFTEGLNILTGETGAGKSLLVGAIGLILGQRADAAVVNDPEQKCVVEADFTLEQPELLAPVFAELELDPPGSTLTIRREIAPGGKSRAFADDTPINLTALRTLALHLVELHGQHEGQLLTEAAYQLALLDRYAGSAAQAAAFGATYRQWRKLADEIAALKSQEAEAQRQADYYQYQYTELAAAKLNADEEAELDTELNYLRRAEEVGTALAAALETLQNDPYNVADRLAATTRSLDKLAGLKKELATENQKLHEAATLVQDAAAALETLAAGIEADPNRLLALTERQDLYNRLKMKYGVRDTAELLALQADLKTKADQFASLGDTIAEKETQLAGLQTTLVDTGLTLEAVRQIAAAELSTAILTLLHEVGMDKASFEVSVERLAPKAGAALPLPDGTETGAAATGINQVGFRISANPGQPLAGLEKVASGGELSRVMLAIKAALATRMALATLILDEIDTGISGPVALKVGRVMERMAAGHQLISITHLPQIASRQGRHYFIYKETDGQRTASRLRLLDDTARATEIAKMMSGDQPGEAALASARELLAAR